MKTPLTSKLDRREFLGAAATALLAGVAIQILGCNDDVSTNPPGDLAGSIGAPDTANHGHAAILTQAQINAGAALTLDIAGTAGHSHTVDLTAQDMADIKANKRIVKAASNIGHYHTVTFN